MWYNDLLMITLGSLALLMIVMAIVVLTRPRKLQAVIEEPEPEKILVEKGFETPNKDEAVENEPEKKSDHTLDFIQKPEIPEYMEPIYDKKVEIDSAPALITEPIPVEPIYEEPEPTQKDESVEIHTIEPSIINKKDIESELVDPIIHRSHQITEADENVVITPNQTFYDPIEEKPNLDSNKQKISIHGVIKEEDPEIELPPSETKPLEPLLKEMETFKDEQIIKLEPEIISLETVKPTRGKRIRKPVIDESDPNLKIDLGVEKCPHCGSRVPNTIYCINCGKELERENKKELEEE